VKTAGAEAVRGRLVIPRQVDVVATAGQFLEKESIFTS